MGVNVAFLSFSYKVCNILTALATQKQICDIS